MLISLISTSLLSMALFLSGIFWSAALHKWQNPAGFRETLEAYQLPRFLIPALVPLLIVLEISLALGMLIPGLTETAALVLALVLLAYTLVLGLGLLAGKDLQDCGCSGLVKKQPPGKWLLGRNALLIGMAAAVSQDFGSGGPALLPAVPMALFGLGLYFAVEQLMANQAKMRLAGGG